MSTISVLPEDVDRLAAWALAHGHGDSGTAVKALLDEAGRRDVDAEPPEDAAYRATVAAVKAEWQHLIDALRAEGVNAELQQTGGMCFAIVWDLAIDGAHVLLTGSHGPLLQCRADEPEHGGYMAGVYLAVDDDAETTSFTLPGCSPSREHDDARAARYAVALARAMYDAERPGIA